MFEQCKRMYQMPKAVPLKEVRDFPENNLPNIKKINRLFLWPSCKNGYFYFRKFSYVVCETISHFTNFVEAFGTGEP